MENMSTPPTAILFPGQGAQANGMGRHLAEASSDAMQLWKKAEAASGLPLRAIYWESGDENLMAETRTLQPAITVVNLALWFHLCHRLDAACAAGHSLGEFSALGAAGVLDVEHLLEIVALRGRLMAEADPDHVGTMYAVLRLGLDDVEAIVKNVGERTGKLIRVANRNTPGQFAVSGHRDAMDDLVEEIRNRKGKAIPLAVSGAFHTPLMAEAATEFAKILDRQDWHDARFPVYCNVSGAPLTEGKKLHAAVRRQMTSSVLWTDTITHQWKDGVRRWVEFGPKGVLSRMVRPILTACDAPDGSYAIEHIPNLEAATAFAG